MKIKITGALALVTVLIAAWFGLANTPPGACTSTVGTTGAAVTALEGAGANEVICLSDGTYGTMTLDQARSSDVTLRAEHPGDAHLGEVTFSDAASHYRLSEMEIAGVVVGSAADVSPSHITIDRNLIQGGGYGVFAESPPYPVAGGCCSTSPKAPITDLAIRNNVFGAVTVEDAIRIDGVTRASIIHNEFTGVIPPVSDAHTDCIQSVWGATDLVIKNNYFHANDCQPIFVGKDGDVTDLDVEQNLIVRDRVHGGAAFLELVSWINPHNATVRHNTFIDENDLILFSATWSHGSGNPESAAATGAIVDHNVFAAFKPFDYDVDHDNPPAGIFTDPSVLTENHNVMAGSDHSYTWVPDHLGTCSVADDTPAFSDPESDDYRLSVSPGGSCGTFPAGITWVPADQTYGPGS